MIPRFGNLKNFRAPTVVFITSLFLTVCSFGIGYSSPQVAVIEAQGNSNSSNQNASNSGSSATTSPQQVVTNPISDYVPLIPWFQLLLQLTVGGLAAGLALYLANRALDYYRRPVIEVDKQNSPILARFDIEVYSVNNPLLAAIPNLRTRYEVRYIANRVIVKNKGRTAAENCKGVIRVGNTEEKVAWIAPNSGTTMTINANSVEYLDLCAVLEGDPTLIVPDICAQAAKLPASSTNPAHQTVVFDDVLRTRTEVPRHYTSADALPRIIAPTENRILASGMAQVIISVKNAKPCVVDIEILSEPMNGRIIRFT